MNSSTEYWIWLSCGLNAGFNANPLLNFYKTPQKVYEMDKQQWVISGMLTPKAAERLSNFTLDEAKRILAQCQNKGWSVITPDSEHYPPLLRSIRAYPLVLFVNGDASHLAHPLPIAFVGTREASQSGLLLAESYASSLSKAGALIVSGGALGIDSAAHMGALQAGFPTIAFLGCGFNSGYLQSNRSLREAISRHGACVSEFPPDTPASRATFPIRNRLIAGMSQGTVVVEAGLRSGSLITARNAIESGRDVFAFPGELTSSIHAGTNKLLKEGAHFVTSRRSIMGVYESSYPELVNMEAIDADDLAELPQQSYVTPTKKKTTKNPTKTINREQAVPKTSPKASPPTFDTSLLSDDTAKKVYDTLSEEPMTVDEIALATGLDAGDILIALTDIEVCGGLIPCPNKKYKKE